MSVSESYHACPRGNGASGPPEFQIVSTIAGMAELEDEWREFFTRVAMPHQVFQSFPFLWHWTQHYLGRNDRLRIIMARLDGRLVAVLPLVVQRRLGIDMLRVMGAPAAQFSDVLLDCVPGIELEQHIRQALSELDADLFFAQRMRADSALTRLMPASAFVFDEQAAPYADLARRVGTDGPGEAYSSKVRSNYRRRMRRLAEKGGVAIRCLSPGSAAALLARQAVGFKREALRRAGLYSPTVRDARFGAFFEAMAADPRSDAALFVTVLDRAGAPVAIDLSFDCRGHSFGHVLATDLAGMEIGAGQLLVHAVFAEAKARGSIRFELMAPADTYKMHHADGVIAVDSRAIGFNSKGRLACRTILRHGLRAGKSLVSAAPRSLVRILSARQ